MDKEDQLTPSQEGGKQPEATSQENSSPSSDGNTDGHADKSKFIPRDRFDEVNNRMKEAEAKLAQIEAEKAQQAEAEALKKWEHEKIIREKQAQIDTYKTKESDWAKRTEAIQAMVDAKYKDIETAHGPEILNKIKNLIGSDDPWVALSKFDDVLSIVSVGWSRPQGGQQHQAWESKTTLDSLKDKINKGERLSPTEEKIYFEELAKL